MFNIFGNLKTILLGVVAALLPILYIIGRRDGVKGEVIKQMKDAQEAAEETAEFYREIEQENNEIESTKPRTRDDLSKRLRGNGL